MFGVRKRWPVLTAVGATLLYVVNNYQISGLENLRLKPLPRARQTSADHAVNPFQQVAEDGLGFDLTQFGIQHSPTLGNSGDFDIDPYSNSPMQGSPAWRDLLSIGEKLALWQDKLAPEARLANGSTATSPGIPTSSPIPAPDGISGVGPNTAVWGAGDISSTLSASLQVAPVTQEGMRGGTMTSLEGEAKMNPTTNPSSTFPNASLGNQSTSQDRRVRIASFAVPALGPAMLSKPNVVQMLVAILRQYDVVALQGIQSSRDDVLPLIVDKLNQSGRSFDYLIGPRVGRAAPHHQFAFVFDTATLETDRFALYSVDDPEDLMTYEPLVGWFRCKGAPQRDAFTFSLVNMELEPSYADAERALIPGLIDAIEKDGRQEDDWIMVGDFAGGNAQLSHLDAGAIRFALSDIPTDVAGTRMLDTLLFSARATNEFTGRAGAFDFLRKYNLSIERALEVSEHMPVWAEFSCIEGSQPGRIAPLIP